MKISLIAAIGLNNELGFDQKMLCHLPSDLKYFREKTLNKKIVMGRKTYESIGRVLKERVNIILSKSSGFKVDGATVFNDFKSLMSALNKYDEEIMIIGGAKIYSLFMPYAKKLYLTKINSNFQADTFFPEYFDFTKIIFSTVVNDGVYQLNFLEMEKK
ncbi:MAG: diacylglycerol kinase [Candidatus Cloacimonadota bacterium]|nr:MAG: diacylglycerol kinase [Candidatus Cloacimonadota bacterium]